MCGRLHCETQSERPVFGDPSSVISAFSYLKLHNKDFACRVIRTNYVGSKTNGPDPGMVPDGSVCGRDKVGLRSLGKSLDVCGYKVHPES